MNRILQLIILLELGSWSVELAHGAPFEPARPYPVDLATDVPANADLTWTPGDTELIRNGGFETGNFTSWTRVNSSPFPGSQNNTYINDGVRVPFNGDGPYPPYAGSYCAISDVNAPGLISIYQDIFVPNSANSVWLTWADRIHNFSGAFVPEPPDPQVYRVEVRRPDDTVLALAYRTEEGHPTRTVWNKRAFDLTPYKGQTLRLAFLQEQWRAVFNMYYDNISVRVRDTGPVTYDVFFGTNSVPGSNEFRGTVSTGSYALAQLVPQRTYFWRVHARIGTNIFASPIWRFTTAPVGPLDHFTWEHISSPQAPGIPVNVSLGARDAVDNPLTNLTGSVMVNARRVEGISTNSLQHDMVPAGFAAYENSTVGYSFTPNTDLLAVGFRTYAGGKVSVWTDDGLLIGSQPPLQLFAGRTYRLGLFSPGVTTNYLRYDGLSTFAHGALNQAYEGSGDAFPTQPHPARWWLVDIIYAVPALSTSIWSAPVNLTAGSWSGPITIPSPALIELRASDGSGHSGIANLFNVADDFRLAILRDVGGDLILRFPTTAGRNYLLESSATLAPNSWTPFGSAIPGTGSVIERAVAPGNSSSFFRVQRTP